MIVVVKIITVVAGCWRSYLLGESVALVVATAFSAIITLGICFSKPGVITHNLKIFNTFIICI